ncbi:hypothetical protein K8R47_03735 [archaeon]|nr:hypothetical protein [archaeon]
MEISLSSYIKSNLDECLNNESLQVYEIYGLINPEIEVEIEEQKTFVKVLSPIEISYQEVTAIVSESYSIVDSNFGKLYSIATETITKNDEDNFLEQKTIDMFVLYDELPLNGINFDCTIPTWSKTEVESNLKEIIEPNMQSITLRNSLNENPKKYYILEADAKNTVTDIMYSREWPLYLEVYPSENGILTADNIYTTDILKAVANLFCFNNYHFVYDVKYPILIKISENDEVFQFAYQIIIDNNQPKQNELGDLELEKTVDICENKVTPITVNTYTEQLGILTPLTNVDISYSCVSQKCHLGKSESATFTTEFPQCINGLLVGEQANYFKSQTLISTNQESQVVLILEPLQSKEYEVKVINSNGNIRSTTSDELALITLESDLGYSTQLFSNTGEIKLIPDNYDISIYLMNNDTSYTIEEQTVTNCVEVPRQGLLGLFGTQEKCIESEIPEIELDSVIVGSAQFDFDITSTTLDNSNKVIFYVNYYGLPESYEDIARIYEKIDVLDENFIYPTFENE